jgi:glycosyltransferase involved in cell wall biosynthesis
VRWNLRHSTSVLTVSDFSDRETRKLMEPQSAPISMIYNAVDTERFKPASGVKRRSVLTVAYFARDTIERKGLRLFWETAALMPEQEFVAVGPALDHSAKEFVAHGLPNLHWTGPLEGDALLRKYQEAAVYFQGSHYESFSLSTAEGMACGCIPVVSRRGALPEVTGDSASFLEALTPESAVTAIRKALKCTEECRVEMRARVVERFPLSKRREALFGVIDGMLAPHSDRKTSGTRYGKSTS